MSVARPQRVLFICTGNLCRSPTAEAIAREIAGQSTGLEFDSAGTQAVTGHSAAADAIAVALAHGVDLRRHRARAFTVDDFAAFDLLVAMDLSHLDLLKFLAPSAEAAGRIRLLADFAPKLPREIPDPYGLPREVFAQVYAMIAIAVEGMMKTLTNGVAGRA